FLYNNAFVISLNYNWKCLYSEIIFFHFIFTHICRWIRLVGLLVYGYEDFHGSNFAFHVIILLVFLMIKMLDVSISLHIIHITVNDFGIWNSLFILIHLGFPH
ncbi:hypothetical protein ACJX0J_008799, partial [Zea mays]